MINVLVVEDDDSNYFLIEACIEALELGIYRAINNTEIWDLLNSNIEFSLVIMDVQLPCGINGIDLSRQIKQTFP